MPDTRMAFEREPRTTRLDTTVERVADENDRHFVVLADTILFPEGGGQPADHGTIAGIEVVDVQRVADEVRHFVAGRPDGVTPGREVTVTLDWIRRFDHMQQHTAQHLLTAIAEARFGWRTTAFHLGATMSDIELDAPSVDDEQLLELEELVAVEIRAARPVSARRVSAEAYEAMSVRSRGLPAGHTGSVRLVEIEGIDVNTCGGTHCGSTAEIESLALLGTESMRGGSRLFWLAGARLRASLRTHHERNARLRAVLGAADDDLVEAVGLRIQQIKDAQRAERNATEELAVATADRLALEEGPTVVAHWPTRDLAFLQRVARELDRPGSGRVVFLTCGEGDDGSFVLSAGDASGLDVPQVGTRVAEVLDGRGGGSGRVFQGRVKALSRRAEAARLLGHRDDRTASDS